MAMTLEELVQQLRTAYRDHLSAVVLYGSGASSDYVEGKSDYNVLVLLDRIDVSTLAAASAVARAWREFGNPPPMTMTVDEWRRSADVFPMEYTDILQRHRVLFGAPPFEGIAVSREHLRLQLEQQVMGKLLRLRQGALLAGSEGKRQRELISDSLSTIMVLFRAVLRLKGEEPPTDTAALVDRVAALAGFDGTAFTRAVQHQRGEPKIAPSEAGAVLAQYLTGVERLDAFLDTFTTQERAL